MSKILLLSSTCSDCICAETDAVPSQSTPLKGDNGFNRFLQRCSGAVTDPFRGFIQRWNSSHHILEAFFVRLLIRNINNLRVAAGGRPDLERQFLNCHRHITSKIEDFAACPWCTNQRPKRFDHVPDEGKASGLLPAAVDCDR